MVIMSAASLLAFPTALSGAFTALIRLGFGFLPCSAAAGEAVPWPPLSTLAHSIRAAVTDFGEHGPVSEGFVPELPCGVKVMALSKSRSGRRLPRRFPVGAKYVVEGYGGAEGQLRVIARYVVLPGGRRISLTGERVPSFSHSRRKIRAGTALKNLRERGGTAARASR
jgi:hypothetical protein